MGKREPSWTKWNKYRLLIEYSAMKGYLPETQRCTEERFALMLEKHGSIFAKPIGGYGGNGVIQILRLPDDRFRIQVGTKRIVVDNIDEAWRRLHDKIGSRYIVQQTIDLARYRGRPYDLRVMVQRKRGTKVWHVTGELAKVAGAGHIITNVRRSGGYVTTATRAIAGSVENRSANDILSDVRQAARVTAESLARHFPKQREMGIDIGVDRDGNVWLIEANFLPSRALFLKLQDKSMHRKIKGFHG